MTLVLFALQSQFVRILFLNMLHIAYVALYMQIKRWIHRIHIWHKSYFHFCRIAFYEISCITVHHDMFCEILWICFAQHVPHSLPRNKLPPLSPRNCDWSNTQCTISTMPISITTPQRIAARRIVIHASCYTSPASIFVFHSYLYYPERGSEIRNLV